ncbi:multicopper oxidase family protein [Phycicoccus jejuensis]|uniref:multicopper oxidase family protein n=1 Tax=Phycicoccus jejuensis TaxID=367299 RepID=UPI00384F64D0
MSATRRSVLTGGLGLLGLGALSACGGGARPVGPRSAAVASTEAARHARGLVTTSLRAAPATVDLGGVVVDTWAFGDTVPGPTLRVDAGQVLRVDVRNDLPADTSVHWHGIRLRNDMDGVPMMTQDAIRPGGAFRYEFTVPDPGTYFFHPHVGVQLDRGLYGVLVVEDPHEPGRYDDEWVLVLDDWVDGTGRTPDDVLAGLTTGSGSADASGGHGMGGSMSGMGGMGSGGMGGMSGGGGDVVYPHYLVNGRVPDDPDVLRARPGDRIRLRVVNAASDTVFRLSLDGHHLTVTHSDGWPVEPVKGDALLIAMGERYDLLVTLGDGAFPLTATPEGKDGQALALVRTASGTPSASAAATTTFGTVLSLESLRPLAGTTLAARESDRTHDLALSGSMNPYRWTINGRSFPDTDPLEVRSSERVSLAVSNMSMMVHPFHLHGHTFSVRGSGVRKDTVLLRPMQRLVLDLDADNPGQWAAHCHNAYHAETGMMTTLGYVT